MSSVWSDVRMGKNTSTKEYTAHIDIYGLNRAGLLNDVLQVLSNLTSRIFLLSMHSQRRI